MELLVRDTGHHRDIQPQVRTRKIPLCKLKEKTQSTHFNVYQLSSKNQNNNDN